MSLSLSDFIYHFHNGSSTHAFEHMGCHPENREGRDGFVFRVWAPNAQRISVVGDFNFWNGEDLPMVRISGGRKVNGSGMTLWYFEGIWVTSRMASSSTSAPRRRMG